MAKVMLKIFSSSQTYEEKLNRLNEAVTDATNARIVSKDSLKSLQDYKKKYEELSKA